MALVLANISPTAIPASTCLQIADNDPEIIHRCFTGGVVFWIWIISRQGPRTEASHRVLLY